jgi:hypothetical protein
VSANFTQLADITSMPQEVLDQMDIVQMEDGMLVAGPVFLRIDLAKQLAEQNQPARLSKVFKRWQLLNRNYPLPCNSATLKPLVCISDTRLPRDQLAQALVEYINQKKRIDNIGLPIVGSTLLPLYEKLGYKLSPELRTQLDNYRCLTKEVALVDFFSTSPKDDAVELLNLLTNKFPQVSFSLIRGPPAKEIFEERWVVTTGTGERIAEFLGVDKCLGITNVNGTYFGTIDSILAVMFSKLFVDTNIVSDSTRAKQMCLLQLLMDEIRVKAQFSSSTGEFARFPQLCYGPEHNLSDIFKERWQERVDRLIAAHKGDKTERSGAFGYRPNDIALARKGLVDARLGEMDFGQGKMSVV